MGIYEEARNAVLKDRTRRHFLESSASGLGAIAMAAMGLSCSSGEDGQQSSGGQTADVGENPLSARPPHFAPGAKRVIYLHMAGAPSQLELFDYKPELQKLHGQACPESLLEGKQFAFIQGTPKMLGPQANFKKRGESGMYVSELMPHFAEVVDEVTMLKAVQTDEFNHAPAQLLMYTGSPRLGRPSMGSWVTYGLGSENENLPGYVVLVSGGTQPSAGKSVWGSGFLPTVYQGVQCRSEGDPVLYVSNPNGMDRKMRRQALDAINKINEQQFEEMGDPETTTRISQYEMAYRMQMSVPNTMDISEEPEYIHNMYGTEPGKTSFANNCLLARRLVEKGVRFVQLFDWGWDSHGTSEQTGLKGGFQQKCECIDRPIAALLKDLKQRGLLEETLVVWGGEFGRTPMLENRAGTDNPYIGRDHHSDAFTMWMAGGGVKKGFTYGKTDEIGFQPVEGSMHVHDLQATILHLLGMDHKELTYHFQGREFRLTDVHGNVVEDVLA